MDSQRPTTVTVFCTDDHAGCRNAVRSVIEATPGFMLVGEASSGEDAIVSVLQLRPDLLLMDVHMPGMSGFEAATWLARDQDGPVIVLMSADPELAAQGPGNAEVGWPVVMKSELCPRRLRELWTERKGSAGS